MDTIAKYRLGPEKLEKIQAENKEKIERLQSTYQIVTKINGVTVTLVTIPCW